MLTEEANERLTRVGPGTPCGELLRRYWQPLCALSELRRVAESRGQATKRVRILGEDLVVFRDGSGRLGCLAEQCSHRGCSLHYGFVEQDGLRCPYHGWKYDADGRCLEQPFEPHGSTYRNQIRQRSYPVESLAGMAFVYMGPQPAPLLPRWDVLVWEDGVRQFQMQQVLNCSWLQAQENTADTLHTYFLHGHMFRAKGLRGGEYYYRPIVRYDWKLCEWGVEKICEYGGDRPEVEVRPPLLFPNMLRIDTQTEDLHWRVPIDDTHTRIIIARFLAGRDGDDPGAASNHEPEMEFLPAPTDADGDYLLEDFLTQDRMAWETQGPVYDRSQEHLGASDRGIAMFRKLLMDQMDRVEAGEDPMALVRDPACNRIIEFTSSSRRRRHVAPPSAAG